MKLGSGAGNADIRFRGEVLPGGAVKGPQARIGADSWGKLYDEKDRGIRWNRSAEALVRPGDWNEYEIIATGSHIRTFVNGKPCVDLDDLTGPRRGILALQIHSGSPLEVRFKELALEVSPIQRP